MHREIALFNDPWSFFALNFNWQFQNNFASGSATAGPYSGFTSATPILRSVNNNPDFNVNPNYQASRVQNILITTNVALANTLNVTDDGNGNLIGDVDTTHGPGTNLINYDTGEITNLYFN